MLYFRTDRNGVLDEPVLVDGDDGADSLVLELQPADGGVQSYGCPLQHLLCLFGDELEEFCVGEEVEAGEDASVLPQNTRYVLLHSRQVALNLYKLLLNACGKQFPQLHPRLCALVAHRLAHLLVQSFCVLEVVVVWQFFDVQQPALLLHLDQAVLHAEPDLQGLLCREKRVVGDGVLFERLCVRVGQ